MRVLWNRVTWYSKAAAMALFVALPFLGFFAGTRYGAIARPAGVLQPAQSAQVAPEERAATHASATIARSERAEDLRDGMSFREWKQLFAATRAYVASRSAEGIVFDLVFRRRVGEWVAFDVVSETHDTDVAQVFAEKVDGVWTPRDMGTAFPELAQEHPELFERAQ